MYCSKVKDVSQVPAFSWGPGCTYTYSLASQKTRKFEELDNIDYLNTNIQRNYISKDFMRKTSQLFGRHFNNLQRYKSRLAHEQTRRKEAEKSSRKKIELSLTGAKSYKFVPEVDSDEEGSLHSESEHEQIELDSLQTLRQVDFKDPNRIRFKIDNVYATLSNIQACTMKEISSFQNQPNSVMELVFFVSSYLLKFAMLKPDPNEAKKPYLQKLVEWLFYYHNSYRDKDQVKVDRRKADARNLEEVVNVIRMLFTSGKFQDLVIYIERWYDKAGYHILDKQPDNPFIPLDLLQEVLQVLKQKKFYYQQVSEQEKPLYVDHFNRYRDAVVEEMQQVLCSPSNHPGYKQSPLYLIAKTLCGDVESIDKLSAGDWRVFTALYLIFVNPFATNKCVGREIHRYSRLHPTSKGSHSQLFECLIDEDYHAFVQYAYSAMPMQLAVTLGFMLDQLNLLPKQETLDYLDGFNYRQHLLRSLGNWMIQVDGEDSFSIIKPYLKQFVKEFPQQENQIVDVVISSKLRVELIDTHAKYLGVISLCKALAKLNIQKRMKQLFYSIVLFQAKQQCFSYMFMLALVYTKVFPSQETSIFLKIHKCCLNNIANSEHPLAFNYKSLLQNYQSFYSKASESPEALRLAKIFKNLVAFAKIAVGKDTTQHRRNCLIAFLEQPNHEKMVLHREILQVVKNIVSEEGNRKSDSLVFSAKLFMVQSHEHQKNPTQHQDCIEIANKLYFQ